MHDRSKKTRMRLWAVAFWLLVWQAAAQLVGKELLLVSPVRTVTRLWELAGEDAFWNSVAYTLVRIAEGFVLGMAAGVLLAIPAGRWRSVRDLLAPLMLTVKTVPVASFIVVVLIWFSSKQLSVTIGFLMVLPIVYTNTLEGILARDPLLAEAAKVHRVGALRRGVYIDLPQVLPFFRSGCRVALGLCWKAGVAAEVIGQPKGSIGAALQQAKVYFETRDVFAWTLAVILLSLLFEKLVLGFLSYLEKQLEHL